MPNVVYALTLCTGINLSCYSFSTQILFLHFSYVHFCMAFIRLIYGQTETYTAWPNGLSSYQQMADAINNVSRAVTALRCNIWEEKLEGGCCLAYELVE